MPEKISREVKHEALTLVTRGTKQAEAAAKTGISDRTIRRARSKAKNHGDIEGGKKKVGRKAKLTPEMEGVFYHSLLNY